MGRTAKTMRDLIANQGREVRLFVVPDRTAGIDAIVLDRKGFRVQYQETSAVEVLGKDAPVLSIRLRRIKGIAVSEEDGR